ncbi:RHS repeat-associated core domain-containing protein [Paenibacillus sp. ISL-20]|uniref:RHS repeat domain-containing protein n=1 Tax=Paenibacillus sp. ISL-20 TaxID=2819163 RepID=UPI001BE8FB09|nr:RHS repeat-associated core domain-containing protein [Paenibacillus sp. ISL-20]MBT2765566.1 RHS repeat-associated core domain-containing protein [Paenibacillus sp. ISL-20]
MGEKNNTMNQIQIPEIRTFQFDSKSVGDIKNSVNLFRGDVNFSENIVSLSGRNGLDVNVTAIYLSNVQSQINKTNEQAPTGIMGLGWEMPYDRIYRGNSNAYEIPDINYTLETGGNALSLVRTAVEISLFDLPTTSKLLLTEGKISHELAGLFHKNGIRIGTNATVRYRQVDENWLVTDYANEMQYKILPKDERLLVYNGGLGYETVDYQFWKISYYPDFERWVVIKENGITYSFGGGVCIDNNGNKSCGQNQIQWGVRWGNWIGSSSLTDGQEQYPRVWNMHIASSLWGDTIQYEYETVEQKVGSESGRGYTKACYLKSITDVFGRKVIYFYRDKEITEYADPHKEVPDNSPNPYQDCYETKYLESIQVHGVNGHRLFSVQFDFCIKNVSDDSSNPHFNKRYLTNMVRKNPDGNSLPGILFEYTWTNDPNQHRGGVRKITYPDGGSVTYTYEKNFLKQCDRSIQIDNPWPGKGSPRIWYGSDYAVVIWYSEDDSNMRLTVYSWVGKWYGWSWAVNGSGDIQENIDIESLNVQTGDDFFALLYKTDGTSFPVNKVFVFHKNEWCQGQWHLPYEANFNYNKWLPQSVAGDSFVIVYNASENAPDNKMTRLSWDTWQKKWIEEDLGVCPDPNRSDVSLTAGNGYYIVMDCPRYDSQNNRMQMFYRDGKGLWHYGPQYSPTQITLARNSSGSPFYQWAAGQSMAAFAYINYYYNTGCEYNLLIFQWDEGFTTIRQQTQAQKYYLYTSILPWISTGIIEDSLVASGPFLYRYNGAEWKGKSIDQGYSDSNTVFNWYSYAEDLILSSRVDQAYYTDPVAKYHLYQPASGTGSFDKPGDMPWHDKYKYKLQYYPTAGVDYVTFDKEIFYRGTNWVKPDGNNPIQNPIYIMPNIVDTRAVINFAPEIIIALNCNDEGNPISTTAYYLSDGKVSRSENIYINRNGSMKDAVYYQIVGKIAESIQTGLEVNLNGKAPSKGGMLALYAKGEKFEEAGSIQINKYISSHIAGCIEDYPITSIAINDGYNTDYTSYQYNFQSALADPSCTVAKYYEVKALYGSGTGKYGYTVYNYFNGIMPDVNTHAYPSNLEGNDEQNYYSLLDGMLYKKKSYNNEDKCVEAVTTSWRAYTTRSDGQNLYKLVNGYVRMRGETAITDGVENTAVYQQNLVNGQDSLVQTSNYNINGQEEIIRTENKYLFEGYEIATGLNYLTPVIQEKSMINGIITGVKVEMWKLWEQDTGEEILQIPASWKQYMLSTYTDTPDFPFQSESIPTQWVQVAETVKRTRKGLLSEMIDIDGIRQVAKYDEKQMLAIAGFVNANADEVLFCSFEGYENTHDWQFDANAQLVIGEGHCGKNSVEIRPGAALDGLKTKLEIARCSNAYLVSFWIKTPDGFDGDTGEAGCHVILKKDQQEISRQISVIPPTSMEWSYISSKITVPQTEEGGRLEIEIYFDNNKTTQSYLLDDIRFSPFLCTYNGMVYDPDYCLTLAQLGSNREANRYIFDEYQRTIGIQGPDDNMAKVSSSAYSRQRNNSFDPSYPNSTLEVSARLGGRYIDFYSYPDWQQFFEADAPGQFEINEGTLCYLGHESMSLDMIRPDYQNNYCVCFSMEGLSQKERLQMDKDRIAQMNSGGMPPKLMEKFASLAAKIRIHPVIMDRKWQIQLSDRPVLGIDYDGKEFIITREAPIITDVGVRIGDSMQILWNAALGQWELYDYSVSSSSVMTKLQPEMEITNWLVIVSQNTLLFYGDGIQIFGYNAQQQISGRFGFLLSQPVALSNIMAVKEPITGIVYTDGSGKTRQTQQLIDGKSLVSGVVYDDIGQEACTTKEAQLAPEEAIPVLAYRKDFAVMNWDNGTMGGEVGLYYSPGGDGYSDDEGYPFSRKVYEASPLGREVAVGKPGSTYAVNLASNHFKTITYQANTGQEPLQLPVGQYLVQTTTDENGRVQMIITDKRGTQIAEIKNAQQADYAISTYGEHYSYTAEFSGVTRTILPPNWYRSSQDESSKAVMKIQNKYNLLGQLVEKRMPDAGSEPGNGMYNYVYTTSGKLRFMQTPEGYAAARPYILYWLYDTIGRVLAIGVSYYNGSLDTLWQYADETGWLPPDTEYLHFKQYVYDSNPGCPDGNPNPDQIGRMTEVTVYEQESNGEIMSVEEFIYDIHGYVTDYTIYAPSFGNEKYLTKYQYDNLGDAVNIRYPTGDINICYSYDNIGRLCAIGTEEQPNCHAELAYSAYQMLGSETIHGAGNLKIQRNYSYNSPGWITGTEDRYFSERIYYSENGYKGAAYYNGRIASVESRYLMLDTEGVFPPSYEYRYAYDGLGRLGTAQNTADDEWSIGTVTPTTYDANDNILAINDGVTENTQYIYQAGSNKVIEMIGSNSGRCEYNLDGAIARVPGRFEQLQYNKFNSQVTRITDADGDTVSLGYAGRDQRVLKTTAACKKLYIHGLNNYPLVELTKFGDGSTTVTSHIYGPIGLIKQYKDARELLFINDHQASVRAVADGLSGQVLAAYAYSPFGGMMCTPYGEGSISDYLYTGQELDTQTGLYNYRSRMYDPSFGRFYSMDSAGQYFSPYIYAGNDPISLVDPDGQLAFATIMAIGAATGAALGAVGGGIYAGVSGHSGGEIAKDVFAGLGIGFLAGLLAGTGIGAYAATAGAVASTTVTSMLTGSVIAAGVNAGTSLIKAGVSGDWSVTDIFASIGVGAVSGAVAWGVGSGISSKLTSAAASRVGKMSSKQLYALGSGIGAVSDGVGTVVGQTVANMLDMAQGNDVNWGKSLGIAAGVGGFFGGINGAAGARFMSTNQASIARRVSSLDEIYFSFEGNGFLQFTIGYENFAQKYGTAISRGIGFFAGSTQNTVSETT